MSKNENSYIHFWQQFGKYGKYEVFAAEKIIKMNGVNVLNYNKDSKFDFITSDGLKYEVKADVASLKTGNIFIEIQGYNKPSGILVSEANYYIITDTINYYMIDIDKLKLLCIGAKIITTKDGSTYEYIIKMEVLISNSILL